MSTALILGGAGYVGRNWARRLSIGRSFDRIIAADLGHPDAPLAPGVDFRRCDVRQEIASQLSGLHPDWIFNFAAVHREPGHAPAEYFDTNVAGARNVCTFAEATGCPNILFTSSISIYGPTTGPTSEASPAYPRTSYGISKLCAELIHEGWVGQGRQHRLVICRPGVIYGPGDPGNILRMIRAVQRGYFVFPGPTTLKKSYGYIEGLMDSFEFAISRDEPILRFNYVEAETETIGQLVRIVRQQLGSSAPAISVPVGLLSALAAVIQVVTSGKSPIHPARVRKAATPTHIIPERLKQLGFRFNYDFRSSLLDWLAKAPEDFHTARRPDLRLLQPGVTSN